MDGIGVVRRLYEAFNGRDEDALLSLLATEVEWHVAGDHPMAGAFAGQDALWNQHLGPLWASPMRVEPGAVVPHGEYVVALAQQIHNFGEGERSWQIVEVFRVRDGRISARWEFISGRDDLDAFLTRGCAVAEAASAGEDRSG